MEEMEILWLVLLILFLVTEGATAAVTTIWFAVGAVAALIAAMLGAEIWLQVVLFAVVSVVCLLALRPVLKKYIEPRRAKTNVDALIGAQGVVLEKIDNIAGTGRVKLSGMEWSAKSATGEIIEAGTVIKVEKIEGVKVFVITQNAKCKTQNDCVGTADGLK